MIDWNSPTWGQEGQNVHGFEHVPARKPFPAHALVRYADNGSWVEEKDQ